MNSCTAYETWVSPCLADLRKYCLYLTRSSSDAEDLFQDTLLKAFVFYVQAKPSAEMKPFILRIARNVWVDDCRKRRRRSSIPGYWTPDCCTDADYAEVRGAIEWLAERFPRRNIEMWLLFNYFGYTMQEIAHATNCTASAVKSILFRTRDMLRRRHELPERRKIAHLDVERWSRAIIQDRPQSIFQEP